MSETQRQEFYGDARIVTPFDPADPILDQEFIFSVAAREDAPRWKRETTTVAGFLKRLSEHRIGPKRGPSYVPGEMTSDRRTKTGMIATYAGCLDVDVGTSMQQIEAAARQLGCTVLVYSTHSHGKTESVFKRDRLIKWSLAEGHGDTFERDEVLHRFLTDVEKWDPEIAATAKYARDEHRDSGIMAVIEHDPMPKHRIVVPFAKPFVIARESRTHSDGMKKWGKLLMALARLLRVPIDQSCLDPSRLFYFPRHDDGKPFDAAVFGGPLFDWTSLVLSDPFEEEIAKLTKGTSKSQTNEGRELGRWSMKRAHGFQIVQALEDNCPEHLRNQTSQGWEITCPFDDEHSNPGDPDDRACMAVNAGDGPSEWFSVRCLHEACKSKTSLDMVGKMVADDWFAREVLDDETYNAVIDGERNNANGAPATTIDPLALIDALTPDSTAKTISSAVAAVVARGLNAAERMAVKKSLIKHLKVGSRDADALLKDARSPAADVSGADSALIAMLARERGGLFELPEGWHLEGHNGAPWICQKNEFLMTPIQVVGSVIYVDRGGAYGLQVDVRRPDGTWGAVDFKAGQLENRSEVLGQLRNAGMATVGTGGLKVMDWLTGTYQTGLKVVHRPGFREGGFVSPTGEVIGVDGLQLDRSSRLDCESRKGTLEGWIEGAEGIFGLPDAHALQAGLLTGWAGAVAGYLGDEPLAYSFEGPPNTGKSSAQELAAAHWASPKVGEGLFIVSKSTEAALELAMERGSGTLTALDEIKHLPPQMQIDLVFLNQGGQGKRRARLTGGEMTTAPGHNWIGGALVVSAETGFADRLAAGNVTQLGGLGRRIATINTTNAPTFERNSREWGFVRAALNNFGWSGPAFVRELMGIDIETVREKRDKLIAALISRTEKSKQSPAVSSAARMIATLELAATVGVKAGLVPSSFREDTLCDRLWDSVMASNIAPTDPAERAADALIDRIVARVGTTIVDFNTRDFAHREADGYHGAEVPGQHAGDIPRKVYVIRATQFAELAGGAAQPAEVRRVLEARGALVRKPGREGKGRTWNGFPGLGKVEYVVLLESAIGEPPN